MSDDIEDVRRVEMRRGKRPIDVDTVKERQRVFAALHETLNYGTVDDFKAAKRVFELSETRPERDEAIRLWNAGRGRN